MRKPFIAGNWKMNKTVYEAVQLVQELSYLTEEVEPEKVDVVVCPPFVALKSISTFIEYEKPNFTLGAQNMHWEREGAYTGEISPAMLKDLKVEYVILGHSERRMYFYETDEIVAKKIRAAYDNELTPILCVGETLEEKESEQTNQVVQRQLFKALDGLSPEEVEKLLVAYEPVWAIGTGKSAFPEAANDVARYLRALVGSKYTPEVAKKLRILYGGSVTPENVQDFTAEPDIDGVLVGGASLEAAKFAAIIRGGYR